MSNQRKAVVAAVGRDRPGLVTEISRLAESHALNIEDSRMTVLGGEFALLMAVIGSESAIAAFRAAAESHASADLSVIFRETHDREGTDALRRAQVHVSAMDHPGIVAAIASFFSERSVNIYNLETTTTPAPHTGTPIFDVSMTIEMPEDVDPSELLEKFAAFCASEDLDGEIDLL